MNDIFEKNSVALILLKIFDIYLCHYFATNKKIAITHLWHAIKPACEIRGGPVARGPPFLS